MGDILSDSERTIAKMSIDALINTDLPDEIESEVDINEALPDVKPKISYTEMKSTAEKKAIKTIDSLLKFYLSADIIEEEEYIKARVELDKMNLSTLIFSMKSTETAIIKLLDTIEGGELGPRMFEVLGGLQKTLLDVVKSQTMYMIAAEDGMKQLSKDLDVYKNIQTQPAAGTGSGSTSNAAVSSRGTKDIMKGIQASIADAEVEDADVEE